MASYVADKSGETVIRENCSGAISTAESLAAELGERLLERGAADLIAAS